MPVISEIKQENTLTFEIKLQYSPKKWYLLLKHRTKHKESESVNAIYSTHNSFTISIRELLYASILWVEL